MTGPEHYKAAETLLAKAADENTPTWRAMEHVAIAQVHATLAVAAATAVDLNQAVGHGGSPEWRAVALLGEK